MLIAQFVVMVIMGLGFAVKQQQWAISALSGGVAALLPDAMFMFFVSRCRISPVATAEAKSTKKISWWLAIGEAVKISISFALLLTAISLQAVVVPLIVSWLSVQAVKIPAVILINSRR